MAVARSTFYHLWSVRQLAPYLYTCVMTTEIHAIVIYRLDYYNSLYLSLSLQLIQKLQLVQSAAVPAVWVIWVGFGSAALVAS